MRSSSERWRERREAYAYEKQGSEVAGSNPVFAVIANLAQSVEHLPRKEKVGGSIPLVGIDVNACIIKQ